MKQNKNRVPPAISRAERVRRQQQSSAAKKRALQPARRLPLRITMNDVYHAQALSQHLVSSLPPCSSSPEIPGCTTVYCEGSFSQTAQSGNILAIWGIPTCGGAGYYSYGGSGFGVPFIDTTEGGGSNPQNFGMAMYNPPTLPLGHDTMLYGHLMPFSNDALSNPGIPSNPAGSTSLFNLNAASAATDAAWASVTTADPYTGQQRYIRFGGGVIEVDVRCSYMNTARVHAVGTNTLRNGIGHLTGSFESNDGNPTDSTTKFGNPAIVGSPGNPLFPYTSTSQAMDALQRPEQLVGGGDAASRTFVMDLTQETHWAKMGCTAIPVSVGTKTITDASGNTGTILAPVGIGSINAQQVTIQPAGNYSPPLFNNTGQSRPDGLINKYYVSGTPTDTTNSEIGRGLCSNYGVCLEQLARDVRAYFQVTSAGDSTSTTEVIVRFKYKYFIAQNPIGPLAILNTPVVPMPHPVHPSLGGQAGCGDDAAEARVKQLKKSVMRADELGLQIPPVALHIAAHATQIPIKDELLSSVSAQSRPRDIVADTHIKPESVVKPDMISTLLGTASNLLAPVVTTAKKVAGPLLDTAEAVAKPVLSTAEHVLPDILGDIGSIFAL